MHYRFYLNDGRNSPMFDKCWACIKLVKTKYKFMFFYCTKCVVDVHVFT